MKISVFINVLNEALRLEQCLQSVQWADEIVIVDMHSEDESVAIARKFTDKIYYFERMGYCEPARKFAVEKTHGEWILNIDADEMVTLGLKQELLGIVKDGQYDAVHIPRKNYFWGEEICFSGCGQLQDRPLRFYKRDAVSFSETIHAGIHLRSGTRVYKIVNPQAHLLHFSYVSTQQYWEKMERYTTIEACDLFNSARSYTLKDVLKDAWDAFWKRYISKGKGYKDGEWGLIYCLWTAVYKLNIYAKYKLMKTYRSTDYIPQIEKKYQAMIQETLNQLTEGNPP